MAYPSIIYKFRLSSRSLMRNVPVSDRHNLINVLNFSANKTSFDSLFFLLKRGNEVNVIFTEKMWPRFLTNISGSFRIWVICIHLRDFGFYCVVTLYNVVTKQENVLLRLTFFKTCRLDVIFIKHYDKNRFILHKKRNQFRQKV